MRRTLLLLCLLTALLSGCSAFPMSETLYRLPKLPREYGSLETRIDELIKAGAEYAAPSSGSNLQSVQMVDLDGDGEEEALAFFRRTSDELPLKIYVFRTAEDSYEQYCMIESASQSIYSVNYVDLDGDGWREILAGIHGELDVRNLSAWSVCTGKPKRLLLTGYSRYAVLDMDSDGWRDLVLLRSDEENYAVADAYVWNGTELELRSSVRLNGTVTELARLTTGSLMDGENALFVTFVTQDSAAIIDILMMEGGALRLVKRRADSGKPCRFLDLYPTDINADGVTETPESLPFIQPDPNADLYYRVCWRQYDATGRSTLVRETYQDTQNGWSLLLPDGWGTRVSLTRTGSSGGSAVTFSRVSAGNAEPFLTVYTLTGNDRVPLALRDGRILLTQQAEAVYAAEIYDSGLGLIDERTLKENFSLNVAEWTTGEN